MNDLSTSYFHTLRSFCSCVFILLLLVILESCARRPPVAVVPPPVPFDTAVLKERADFWGDYNAKLRLRVDSKTSKFSARALVMINGRHFVRFETFGPLGQTAALFVSNEAGPSLLIPSEKIIFTAHKPETLIRHFIGVTMPIEVFRYALAGSVPPEQMEKMESHSAAGVIHAISNVNGRYFDWQFIPEGPALSGVFIRSGEFEGRVSYDPPVLLKKDVSPKKIRISSAEWNMELTLEELKPAFDFNSALFYLPNVPGFRTVDLDTIK
ncbi:MAG: lipoprotein insertase outer membrane protein LolB [Syntrophobacteraceae bacterium]